MGNHAKEMANAGRKLVFIYVTAGDAGAGKNQTGTGNIPFYIAREKAAARSTEFLCANIADSTDDRKTVCINKHRIPTWRYKNTVSYYLRLPDGGMRAEGQISLRKLYKKNFLSLATIDDNIYDGWQDLITTVQEIISREAGGADVEMNLPDVSALRNPGDHCDHYLAGVVGLSATKNSCYTNILYTGYNVVKQPRMLHDSEIVFKQSLLQNIGIELRHAGYPDCQDSWHRSFTENEYSFNEPDACNFSDSAVFYIRKFGIRQEDDDSNGVSYTCALYPNPAGSFLHLSIVDRQRHPMEICIKDMFGNIEKMFTVTEAGYTWEKTIDIRGLPAGTYFLEIRSGEQRTLLRFVKV
jgi:hypothetical protein